MDPRFSATRDDLYNVQMDVKQMQIVQNSHAERLSRLEKRQADDAAIKSAWNSPFPSALGGTPQHGPIQMPPSEMFDDFEEQGQSLLGSLHLDAEDEPARRGAASRANSVRFDESALQGSSWAQNGRQSGEFGLIRPGSGLGMDQPEIADAKKGIRIFIGSETLREHSADVLFSQNRMMLYTGDREKLSVPFVRPEDHGAFKNIRTMAIFAEKPRLNATARPFVLSESKTPPSVDVASESAHVKAARDEAEPHELNTPISEQASQQLETAGASTVSESGGESERPFKGSEVPERLGMKDRDAQPPPDMLSDGTRRASGAGGIWNSWRQGTATNGSEQRESTLLSGYQPAGRGRNMKVLKPMKSSSSSSSARTGAAYEAGPPPRSSGELRRKSSQCIEHSSNIE
ncbi:hypothetical protein ONZ43_g331 [Nemania bipapillata]|uniref:Uncharacterized protein n=1 Tax=Nemania bipapillata TaxID=110536 RepID=A0ACC2J8X5_9PEZI|nr:hypothetical protein ONZ43_g331 [Nemania bipapillata]